MSLPLFRYKRRYLGLLAPALVVLLLLGIASEIDARGMRGGGRGGGMRGGNPGGGGRISRGGPARGGSVRHDRSGGDYRSYDRNTGANRRYEPMDRGRGYERGGSGGFEREGSFETRRGETVDYSGTVTRSDDGLHREGSWTSTSGASGGGSGDIRIEDGRATGSDRTRHAESASGETMNRQIQSERHGDHVEREGQMQTSTGVDVESKGKIKKTDDGFVARGVVKGDDAIAGGTIARKGDQTYIRGGATDGEYATWGRAHCNGSRCYGGRVTAKVDRYYHNSYYYYPYYYYWYSCPYGSVRSWYNRYGSPVYSCSNVVVIHTTISLGSSSSFSDTTYSSGSYGFATEAKVSSSPVLMYEVDPEVVVYATSSIPVDVYAVRDGGFYYWVPGPAKESAEAKKWVTAAEGIANPTANSTVIRYAADGRTVYLTNERPAPGFYSDVADHLFVWIPGVKDPTDEERELIARVVSAHQEGGQAALDREVRKLEENREPPPVDAEREEANDE